MKMQVTYIVQAFKLFICPVNIERYKNKVINIASEFRSFLGEHNFLEIPTPNSKSCQAIITRFEEDNILAIDNAYVGHLEDIKKLGDLTINTGDCLLVGDMHCQEHDVLVAPKMGTYTVWIRRYCQSSVGSNEFAIFSHELIFFNRDNSIPNLRLKHVSMRIGMVFRTCSLGFLFYNPFSLDNYIKKVGTDIPILDRFTGTDEGEILMKEGAILPIIGIQSRTYRLIIRTKTDAEIDDEWVGLKISPSRRYILNSNPSNALILADADLLHSWEPDRAFLASLFINKGPKIVDVCGYVKASRRWNVPTLVTYEIVIADGELLPNEIDEPLINEDLFSMYLNQ